MTRLASLILCALLPLAAVRSAGAGVDYVRDVKPILKHHCYSCHGALKQESKLRLDTAELARKGGRGGPATTPPSATQHIRRPGTRGGRGQQHQRIHETSVA